jgi:cyclic pyranopterin phosphate synthase
MEKEFSHTDDEGNAQMVDIGQKPIQQRTAIAEGRIILAPETVNLIRQNGLKKGDVLTVARIAGINSAKKTSDLIPLCHPLYINHIDIRITLNSTYAKVISTIKCDGKTGVEMEALTATSVALLTIYDMCKAVDKQMTISDIKLTKKEKKNSD